MRCETFRCRNRAAKGRKKCHRCRKADWRRLHPYKAQYARIRDKAKDRGIVFALTFEQFCEVAVPANYAETTGKDRESITIDRIDNTRGYEPGNVRPLTREENAIKHSKADEYRMFYGMRWRRRYQ